MHVDHPVDEDLPHFLGDEFLVVLGIWLLQSGHEVHHILLVLVDGILVLDGRHDLLVAVQRARSALGLDLADDWQLLVDAGVFLDSLVEVGDVPPEEALAVVIVGLEFGQTGQLAVRLVVVDVHSKWQRL